MAEFDPKYIRDFFFMAPSAGRSGGQSTDPNARQLATNGKALKVTLRASHAGMCNGNQVMYAPSGVKNSVHTWTFPHKRPVEIHHDDYADPIGRVIGARYAPFGTFANADGEMGTILKLMDEAKSPSDMVDAANMLYDSGVLSQEDWTGVGELVLDAIITDESAAQKIIDGRYLMVSVAQQPKEAYCNVCKANWVSKPCEHHRGEVDEDSGRKMFLVVGDTRYKEVSYVNHPADEHAGTVEFASVSVDGIPVQTDSLKATIEGFEIVDAIELEPFVDVPDEVPLETASQEVAVTTIADSTETTPVVDNTPATEPVVEPAPEPTPETPVAEVEDKKEEQTPPPPPPPEEEPEPELGESVAAALKVLFEDEDNMTEEHAEAINEALEKEVEADGQKDAVLTTKKRKSLPGASFCGPNRSFPVPDCAHYTAAKRLIGRYKGPGDKSRIMACVERKGKAMSCGGAKTSDSLNCLTSDQLLKMKADVVTVLDSRGIKETFECLECKTKDARLADLSDVEGTIKDLNQNLAIVRDEWKAVVDEASAQRESHQTTLVELETTLKTLVLNHKLLSNKDSKKEDIGVEINAMSLDDLRKYASEASFDDAISFARSGLTQEPEEKISVSDAQPEEVRTIETTKDDMKEIAETVLTIRKNSGKTAAVKYIDALVKRGRLPRETTLANLETLVAQ